MSLKVYTLKNCDTCKKAIKWLTEKGIEFDNHDVRADGLDQPTVEKIVHGLGWELALNRRSTTWRGLTENDKAGLNNTRAVDLILDNPTLMKRPVFVFPDAIFCGFADDIQREIQSRL